MRNTNSGDPQVNPDDAPVPNSETRPDGQHVDHWVLPAEERAKGFVRPVRLSYKHVGTPGPKYELRDLTDEEKAIYSGQGYVKFEPYPESEGPASGRLWTAEALDEVGRGCGTVTSMPTAIAETLCPPAWILWQYVLLRLRDVSSGWQAWRVRLVWDDRAGRNMMCEAHWKVPPLVGQQYWLALFYADGESWWEVWTQPYRTDARDQISLIGPISPTKDAA